MSEGLVLKRKKKAKWTKEVKKLRKIVDSTESLPDTWGKTTNDDVTKHLAWQDARIRQVAAEAFDTVMNTRCTLDKENYRLDIDDMFRRHNETTDRLKILEGAVLRLAKELTTLQTILVNRGLGVWV